MSFRDLAQRSARTREKTAQPIRRPHAANLVLSEPVAFPEKAISSFLFKSLLPLQKQPADNRYMTALEIEVRLGVFGVNPQEMNQRVAACHESRGIFDCSNHDCHFVSGVSKAHFVRSQKYLRQNAWDPSELRTETVWDYGKGERVAFRGAPGLRGRWESKTRQDSMHWTIPSSPFDLRVCASLESPIPPKPQSEKYQCQRIKQRYSYTKKHDPWQIDLTTVATRNSSGGGEKQKEQDVSLSYEVEVELSQSAIKWLRNEPSQEKQKSTVNQWARQLREILQLLNPRSNSHSNIDAMLQEHPSTEAKAWALARCQELRNCSKPWAVQDAMPTLPGSMPANLTRHDLDKLQWSTANDYYVSEKTDGVRHWLVVAETTVVLVDRKLRCKQPKCENPFRRVLSLIQPGTVLDGEVVLNRRTNKPIFIVFDVLAISRNENILNLPFKDRLDHLHSVSFSKRGIEKEKIFEWDNHDPLPLVRKDFKLLTEIDRLLEVIQEEKGSRYYRHGVHNHLTDGIIFQPNLPYVCGTDKKLLKWKYHDMLTIDVKLPTERTSHELRVVVGSSEDTVNIIMPICEQMRMEADIAQLNRETGQIGKYDYIVEVGFHPDPGEWYYVCVRGDKKRPNATNTVVGTFQELAERLTTEELRNRLVGSSKTGREAKRRKIDT